MAKVQTLKEFVPGRGYTQEDWDELDSPEITEEEWATAMTAEDVLPPSFFTWLVEERRRRGRPTVAVPKKQVTLRLDAEVVDAFRAGGKGWQSRVNAALRKAAGL